MADHSLLEIVNLVRANGRMDDAVAQQVRRQIYRGDASIALDEAQALIQIEHARRSYCLAWSQLYVEALTDFVLRQQPPVGYLSEENARWVTDQIKSRKLPSTDGDMALVANLIELAREVPPAFSAFALRLVKETVMYGDGVDLSGRQHGSGRVSDADVALLRRILWGAGSEGLLAVSREEAEALFAIADHTTGADNVPEFENLFAQAIGNYLLGATGRTATNRETALRWETEPAYKVNVLAALSQVFRSSDKVLETGFIRDTIANARTLGEDVDLLHRERNAAREVAMDVASVLTQDEARWLLEHVNKNGLMSPPERALLKFIEREASKIDGSVAELIAKVA